MVDRLPVPRIIPSKIRYAASLPFLLALLGAGCSSSDDANPSGSASDEIEVVPFKSTKMLTAEDVASLQPDTGDGRLVFNKTPQILDGVATGTVIVAGASPTTPNGLLRVVSEAERNGDVLTLRTMAAPPQLAFKKLHARVARPVSLDDGTLDDRGPIQPLGIGGVSERKVPVDVVLFDGDGDKSTTNDQLRIEGAFAGTVAYDLGIDIDWGAIENLPSTVAECVASLAKIIVGQKPSCAIEDLIPEVKLVFTVDPGVAAELRLVGQASLGFEKKFDIATVHLAPLILGPIVFTPTLDIIASVEGGASASFRAGVKSHMTLTSSVTVSSKTAGNPTYAPPSIKDKGFEIEDPEVGLHAHANASIGVRLAMPLYAVAGPYATAEATLGIAADASRTPCWEARAGLESTVGVRITTPSLPFLGHVTLLNWNAAPIRPIDEVVASGQCTLPPPGATHLPPGSGPDAPALLSPTFDPWSTVHEGGSEATATAGPYNTGIVFTDLSRAIDDRWVVAGSEARTLLKMDDLGRPIWRTDYVTDADVKLRVLRTAPTRDAALMLLAAGDAESSFDLVKVGQAGGVAFRRSYALPLDACATPGARVLSNDASTGFVVFGECLSQGKAFVVHVDEAGAVLGSRVWSEPNAKGLSPSAVTKTGDASELVVVGEARGADGDGMFVARLDNAGNVRTSMRYLACETSFNLTPTTVLPAPSGGITVAGGSHSQSRAFVARIHENGDVGFTTFPGMTAGSAPVFVASAIAELPTSGFVMAASSVELTGEGTSTIPTIALVGLDAAGKPTWSKRYALAGPQAPRASSFGALRLTPDGGALATVLTEGANGGEGSTWAMKVHAKDGALTSAAVTSSALVLDAGPADCAVRSMSWAPIAQEIAIASTTRNLRAVRR
jgi:hypothetical protein